MPAVLTENGFYNNRFDLERMLTEEFRQTVADAHVAAIMEIEREVELEQFVDDDSHLPRIRTLRRKITNLQNKSFPNNNLEDFKINSISGDFRQDLIYKITAERI